MNRREFLNVAASFAAYPALASTLAEKLGFKSTASESEQSEPADTQPASEPLPANALDLSAFTDEEILELLAQVQDEMVARGLHGKTANVPKGTYIAGIDLPAGSYVYTSDGESALDGSSEDLTLAFEFGQLTVQNEQGVETASYYIGNYGAETCYISVQDGDTLIIPRRGTLMMSSGGLFFE